MSACRKFHILYNHSVRLHFFKLKNIFWISHFKGFFFCRLETACGAPIPYWESGLDHDMEDPTESILWSDDFFGNGNGVVTTGPFRSMRTILGGPIIRNYGTGMFTVSMLPVHSPFSLDLSLFFLNGTFPSDGISSMIEMHDSSCFHKMKLKSLSRIPKIVWTFYHSKLKYYIERCSAIHNSKLWYFYYKWSLRSFFLKD